MIGSPKQGKTELARDIGRRLPGKLWVMDNDGVWSPEETTYVLRDHFDNSDLDVLVVMRGSRSWFSDPLASCPPALFGMADLVFGVEKRSIILRETSPPITVPDRVIGYTWKCWAIKDRKKVYNHEWVWDQRMPDHEFWRQHVKPLCLNDPEAMALQARREAVPERTFAPIDVGHRTPEEVQATIKRWHESIHSIQGR